MTYIWPRNACLVIYRAYSDVFVFCACVWCVCVLFLFISRLAGSLERLMHSFDLPGTLDSRPLAILNRFWCLALFVFAVFSPLVACMRNAWSFIFWLFSDARRLSYVAFLHLINLLSWHNMFHCRCLCYVYAYVLRFECSCWSPSSYSFDSWISSVSSG